MRVDASECLVFSLYVVFRMATSVLVSFCHTFLILEKFLTLDETESTKKKKKIFSTMLNKKKNVEILHTNNNSDSIP